MEEAGYHKLDVYRSAHDLALRIHEMTLSLPKFEMYEEGSQIRRSSKRVSASIVEGYAVRKYTGLYLNFLYRAQGSADETQEHLRYLVGTKSLRDETLFRSLYAQSQRVSRMMARFIRGVEADHTPPRRELVDVEPPPPDEDADAEAARILADVRRKSEIRNPKSAHKESKNGR